MGDFFEGLYDQISGRKAKPRDLEPYAGGNGRVDRAVDLILNEDFPRSGVLVDVGGAIGDLGYALRDHFESRYVIDISDRCREAAESKGNWFYQSNVDSNGIPIGADGSVDLIVALDFIEHIVDPLNFAKECHRLLRSGGKVLINTPNIQYWEHLSKLVETGHFPHTSGDKEVYHGGHVAFYNLQDLNHIFWETGFVDARMHTRGLTPSPPPPIWLSLARYQTASVQLSYPDLIFSCRKP